MFKVGDRVILNCVGRLGWTGEVLLVKSDAAYGVLLDNRGHGHHCDRPDLFGNSGWWCHSSELILDRALTPLEQDIASYIKEERATLGF